MSKGLFSLFSLFFAIFVDFFLTISAVRENVTRSHGHKCNQKKSTKTAKKSEKSENNP